MGSFRGLILHPSHCYNITKMRVRQVNRFKIDFRGVPSICNDDPSTCRDLKWAKFRVFFICDSCNFRILCKVYGYFLGLRENYTRNVAKVCLCKHSFELFSRVFFPIVRISTIIR